MSAAEHEHPSARLARVEIEVEATPEQVWEAIATSAGNAGWAFPAEIEPRGGGAMMIHRAPYGGDAPATVSVWDPPHRFAYEEPMEGPDGPAPSPWATEFLVEAKSGGSCIVRVVSGFHQDGEAWEDMVEGAGEGWKYAMVILRAYLAHFAGQPAASLDATTNTGCAFEDRAAVASEFLGALGLTGARAGDPVSAPSHAPPLAGVIEDAGFAAVAEDATPDGVLVRAHEPCPGLFEISTFTMDGKTVTVNVSGHLYGPDAPAVVERDQSRWNDWLLERFPAGASAAPSGGG